MNIRSVFGKKESLTAGISAATEGHFLNYVRYINSQNQIEFARTTKLCEGIIQNQGAAARRFDDW